MITVKDVAIKKCSIKTLILKRNRNANKESMQSASINLEFIKCFKNPLSLLCKANAPSEPKNIHSKRFTKNSRLIFFKIPWDCTPPVSRYTNTFIAKKAVPVYNNSFPKFFGDK